MKKFCGSSQLTKLLMMAAAVIWMLSSTRAFVATHVGSVRLPRAQLRAVDPGLAVSLATSFGQGLVQGAAYDKLQEAFTSRTIRKKSAEVRANLDLHVNELVASLDKEGTHVTDKAGKLPKLVVEDTRFQRLLRSVLDSRFMGARAVYAEPAVGKSVAVALEVLRRAEEKKPNEITVLLSHNFETSMLDFFGTEQVGRVPEIAEGLFSRLREDKKKRVTLILDDMFSCGVPENYRETFIGLTKALFNNNHGLIVITQTEGYAREVAVLNGRRTDLTIQQAVDGDNEDLVAKRRLRRVKTWEGDNVMTSERAYRWTEEQARLLFKQRMLQAQIAKQKPEESNPLADLYNDVLKIFTQNGSLDKRAKENMEEIEAKVNDVLTDEDLAQLLEESEEPDGGWLPSTILEVCCTEEMPQ